MFLEEFMMLLIRQMQQEHQLWCIIELWKKTGWNFFWLGAFAAFGENKNKKKRENITQPITWCNWEFAS